MPESDGHRQSGLDEKLREEYLRTHSGDGKRVFKLQWISVLVDDIWYIGNFV